MSKPLILAVDDEVQLAELIAQSVRETERYEAVAVYSAGDALQQLKKNRVFLGLGGNRVRLIILDIKMPGMDGLQFLEKLRRSYGEEIGVIMLTAWEDEEKWDRATSGFVVNYLKKPFKTADLIASIDRFFKGAEEEGAMVLETFEKHLEKREEFRKKT